MIFYYLVENFLSFLIERLINEKTNKYKKSKLSIEPTVLLLSVKRTLKMNENEHLQLNVMPWEHPYMLHVSTLSRLPDLCYAANSPSSAMDLIKYAYNVFINFYRFIQSSIFWLAKIKQPI